MFQKVRDIPSLERTARQARRDILAMIHHAQSGHPGGSLSAVEILVALYFAEMSHDPRNPKWPDRDRFVLSKGHACAAQYAVLAACGYFSREVMMTYRDLGSPLQGHPSVTDMPILELPTGSLGQGLSGAQGLALAGRLDGKTYRTYALLGDGEIQEGQVWEAAMSGAKLQLDTLCAIVDFNGVQQTHPVAVTKPLEPLAAKWSAFGWHTLEVNGHDVAEVIEALTAARQVKGHPTAIIAHTVKGKGVSFMEGNPDWHGKAPNDDQFKKALAELPPLA
jgi:transketolase